MKQMLYERKQNFPLFHSNVLPSLVFTPFVPITYTEFILWPHRYSYSIYFSLVEHVPLAVIEGKLINMYTVIYSNLLTAQFLLFIYLFYTQNCKDYRNGCLYSSEDGW